MISETLRLFGTFCSYRLSFQIYNLLRQALLIALVVALVLVSTNVKSDELVVIEPTGDAELDEFLRNSLTLPLLLTQPDLSKKELSFEIAAEGIKLKRLLNTRGYLSARVEVEGSGTAEDPLRFQPKLGKLCKIGWIKIEGIQTQVSQELAQSLRSLIVTQTGQIATSETLDKLRDGVRSKLRDASFGKASVLFPELIIEPVTRTVGVRITVQSGEPVTLGQTFFHGSFRMNDADLASLIPFNPGEAYSPELIKALQSSLENANLFRSVRITLGDKPNETGVTDIFVKVTDTPLDIVELARNSSFGTQLIILTMLMIIVMESVRTTPFWSNTLLRRTLQLVSFSMIGATVPVIIARLMSFLP